MYRVFFPFSEAVFMMKYWIFLIKFAMDYLGKKYKRMNDLFETVKLHHSGLMCTSPKLGSVKAITSSGNKNDS